VVLGLSERLLRVGVGVDEVDGVVFSVDIVGIVKRK